MNQGTNTIEMPEQLCLLEETTEEKLERKINEMKLSAEKNRKSLHAKNSQLNKELQEVKHELKTLIQALCRTTENQYADLPLFYKTA